MTGPPLFPESSSAIPPPAPGGCFRLVTLGSVQLLGPDGAPLAGPGLSTAVLTYLLSADGRRARREHLADVFWRDSDPRRAFQSLRQLLTRVRHLVGQDAFETAAGDLCLRAPIVSDREEFLAALRAQDLAGAVELYGGEFFPGFGGPGSAGFEQWAEVERAQLRTQFLRAAEVVVRRAMDAGRPSDVLALGRRMTVEAPGWEAGRRLLIEVLAARGDLVLATVEADSLLTRLRDDEQEPEPATLRLVRSLGEGNGHDSEPGSHRGLHAAVVGREQEFHQVMAAWRDAEQGTTRLVHVVGPAGMGKTRMIQDAATRIRMAGGRVVIVAAHAGERALELALASEVALGLGRLPGAVGVDPAAPGVLVGLHPGLATIYPNAPAGTPRRDSRLGQTQAMEDLARTVAEGAPVALFVDDLHWADPASRQILQSLASRLRGSRILLVTATRPLGEEGPFREDATTIHLRPLTAADIEALLDGLGSFAAPATSSAAAAALLEVTDGNPLLVIESLQYAMERGDLGLHQGRWSVADPAGLPATLRASGSLDRRLAQLETPQRGLLVALAVAGTTLAREDLSRILGREPAELEADLLALERRGYVELDGPGWAVAHEEVGRILGRQATPGEIAGAHRRIGTFLASRATSATELGRAGVHLAAAHEAEAMLRLFRRWARLARRNGDRRSVDALAEEFLEEHSTPELVAELGASLPLATRLGFGWRHAAAAALLVATTAGGAAAIASREAERSPDASLIIPVPAGPNLSSLYQIDLQADRWYSPTPIELPRRPLMRKAAREDDYPARDVPQPGTGDVAISMAVADSGVTDLFLRDRAGGLRRLTWSRLDDIDPAWSPDGRFLVFATARWSPPGEFDLDLAMLELRSGAIRRLTRLAGSDWSPVWSPDGTRIAFVRQGDDDLPSLCWTTADGTRQRCGVPAGFPRLSVLAWRSSEDVLVGGTRDGPWTHLLTVNLSTWRHQLIDSLPTGGGVSVSVDGDWGVCPCRPPAGGPERIEVFRVDEPRLRRSVALSQGTGHQPYWLRSRAATHVVRAAVGGADPVVLGVPARLRLDAWTEQGEPITLDRAVISWGTSDSSIAVVDTETGTLTGRRTGTVWVVASAGGWVTDSTLARIIQSDPGTTAIEEWGEGWENRWELFGDPRPVTIPTGRGRAFWSRGDETFESGGVARRRFGSAEGVGAELALHLPIDRERWQRLSVSLLNHPTVVGDRGMHGQRGACGFVAPAGEGRKDSQIMSAKVNHDAWQVAIPPGLRQGWHQARLQVFPDGTCGVALDGTPLWRSQGRLELPGSWGVATSSQSVGNQMLVGRITVWTGVRTDVDWKGLEDTLRVR